MKLLALLALAIAVPAAHADTYAFIVGVNDYPDPVDAAGSPLKDERGRPVSSKLRGCVNDANNYATFVKTKYGVPAANVTVLTDGQATGDGFLKNIKETLGKLKPGDQFFFAFSGHGTRIKDDKSTDEDGKGSAIVLRDYVLVRGNVFGDLAKGLAGAGVKSTFLFDSCFAGGMSRDTNIFGIAGARKKSLDAKAMGAKSAVVPDAGVLSGAAMMPKAVQAAPYAFIYASQKDVTSIDFPGNPEKGVAPQGLFSFALLSILEKNPEFGIGGVVDAIAEFFEETFKGKDIKQRPEDEYSSADRGNGPLVVKG